MNKATILIVEDEEIVAMDLANKLRRLDFEISATTATGEEAVTLAREQHPDLVLMDIRLAGPMDGVTAAEIIRRECDLPIVYLTAHSDRATLQRAKVTEPYGYILKPFSERELEAYIEIALYKHKAEQELRAQREWLGVTLHSIGDAVITTDAASKVTSLNPMAEELTGWQMAEAVGRPIEEVFNIINEESRKVAPNPVERVLREGKVTGLANHTALISRQGEERAIEDSAAPIKDAQGRILGVVMVFHDVTEKRRAEEARRANLAALTRMHELSLRRIERGEMETLLQEIMAAAVEIVGADKGTLQLIDGESLRIVAHHGHKAPFLSFFASAETRASVCGEASKRGGRVVVPDVEQSDLFAGTPSLKVLREAGVRAVQSTPLMSRAGTLLGILTTQWERTYTPDEHDLWRIDLLARQAADLIEHARAEEALRESEERLRSAVDGSNGAEWEIPADQTAEHGFGDAAVFNARLKGFIGFAGDEFPNSVSAWRQRIHPEDLLGITAAARAHIESGDQFYRVNYRIQHRDGSWRHISSTGRLKRDATGRPLRWFGMDWDITELKQAEAVLKRAKEELAKLVAERTERLQELVGELEHFSYTITHDLKSPLRAMRGFAEMMSMTCGECNQAEAKQFLERISTSSDRMDRLIADALNYSRSVRQELPLEDVDAGALLRGILDSYPEFQPSKAGIRVEGQLPVVLANEAGLTQCFSNLLGNAVKFVKPGEMPDIRTWATRRDGWVRIWVEDKGIGIAKEMLPRVFDMFTRGSKAYEGTGIGLALVRKVVQRMGGKVGVESEEGKGSRFWIELKDGEKESAFAQTVTRQAEAAEAAAGTVLYVEDEESDAIFMEQAFAAKKLAGKLRLVGDGRAAINYLSGSGEYRDREKYPVPSVVLLDLNLPHVPGFEVLEWMRNHPDFAKTPVVIFSSSTREDDREKAQRLGANEFVSKPSSGLKFVEVVEGLREKWMGKK